VIAANQRKMRCTSNNSILELFIKNDSFWTCDRKLVVVCETTCTEVYFGENFDNKTMRE
jgi:hypothetical protein